MKKYLLVIILFLIALTVFTLTRKTATPEEKQNLVTQAAAGVHLSFNNNNITANINDDSINLGIMVVPETYEIVAATLTVRFDPDIVEAVTFNANSAYFGNDQATTITREINNTEGTASYSFMVSADNAGTGNGRIATVSFRPKAAGNSQISFVTNGARATTISALNQNVNVLASDGLTAVSQITVSEEAPTATVTTSPTNSPSPTAGVGGFDTPTPTQQQSNNTVPTCALLTISPDSGIKTGREVTYTCTGVDPDGDITAIEIEFGDGNKKVVEKNVGSPGTLSATYTYNTVGTYGASCRVRDNNFVYSGVPGACQKSIYVSASGINTATNSPTGRGTTGPTRKPTAKKTGTTTPEATLDPTWTPTIQPYKSNITPIVFETDKETEDEGPSGLITMLIASVLGGILLLGIFLIIKNRQENKPPKDGSVVIDSQPGSNRPV